MEQWSEIRRQVLTGGLSERQACEQYRIHGKTLAKTLTHEEPPVHRRMRPVRRRTIEPVIRQILDDVGEPLRKQWHIA